MIDDVGPLGGLSSCDIGVGDRGSAGVLTERLCTATGVTPTGPLDSAVRGGTRRPARP